MVEEATSTQVSLGAVGRDDVDERKDRIGGLQNRARTLHKRWVAVFGPHDTPVPIDRGWHNLARALSEIETEASDGRIAAAETHLDEAEWILDQHGESNNQ